ncbi:undecaprenyldiphospho-muramoylpentapeptide beta-N-acetylglucosaminyltransferase [Halomonas dongshanensis]|uniref:UDP-N-acetylglucosamine--N-acetylmuramyl-(pentapeptide) pyrophosphoryl-undecaprenol N-acetylglucosamine transferase n=1 Tax=Halomonas dongshanensis TaxID=2890835 RepID=A0ABT2EEL8_9GAMM|nr:undecaprenyldiphospho-muramoylpentapeptide beta-N-acetylglucosaminyltransferase [Halomonas dongshanensis]
MTTTPRRVLIMAGGTGGHVIPALSLARALIAAGIEVEWLGSPRGIENRLVPEAGIRLHTIAVAGLRGKGVAGWVKAPFNLARAVSQARGVLSSFRPQLVVGLGGFASGPGGLAAWLGRIPLIIHEQNAIEGLTNRVLSRLAKRTYAAFSQAFGGRAEVIGNPVRDDIAALGEAPKRADEMAARPLRLLVVGGSLGAVALNERLPEALAALPGERALEIHHQSGRDRDADTAERYRAAGVVARVEPFIDDMAAAYAWADLVVCRSGALTVAELAAAAKPSLLVPFPFAVDDHQRVNAEVLVEAEAAVCVVQAELGVERLTHLLDELLDPEVLARMAANARRAARLTATAELLAGCMDIINQGETA